MREMACEEAVQRRRTDSPKVQAKEEESTEERKKDGRMEARGHPVGENAIIKYKGWNTYCGDYGSFPYIQSTLPVSQGECSGARQWRDRQPDPIVAPVQSDSCTQRQSQWAGGELFTKSLR